MEMRGSGVTSRRMFEPSAMKSSCRSLSGTMKSWRAASLPGDSLMSGERTLRFPSLLCNHPTRFALLNPHVVAQPTRSIARHGSHSLGDRAIQTMTGPSARSGWRVGQRRRGSGP